MKRWLCGALGLAMAITLAARVVEAQTPARPGDGSVKEKLIGAWRLAWDEEPGPNGKPKRVECQGMIADMRDGHLSVQIILPTRESTQSGGPLQYEKGGYEAYYGTHEVNEQANTVTHHGQGALVRTLIGKDLTRVYRFSDKQLILKSFRPDEHWTLAWERY
jgi:Lipocalin-like domain